LTRTENHGGFHPRDKIRKARLVSGHFGRVRRNAAGSTGEVPISFGSCNKHGDTERCGRGEERHAARG
jgi:hypothetical protein